MDPVSPVGSSLMASLRAAASGQGASALSGAASALRAFGMGEAGGGPAAPGGAGSFGSALARALEQVDATQKDAGAKARSFQLGDPSASLEDTMITMQKANISFHAMVQVRNRVISAYHDIMNMSV